MSEPLRIALVAEGITDYIVFKAAIGHLLDQRSHDVVLLQPEESVAFTGAGDAGILGGGWKGVHKWCHQSAENPPIFNLLFQTYDVLIVHLDADVGEARNEKDWPPGLPCVMPCPPVDAKTNALRAIAFQWLGLTAMPEGLVFCTPSKSTESWMMWLFCPNDREMQRLGWECHPNPAGRLSQQPKSQRFEKNRVDYQARQEFISENWPNVAGALSEAKRFESDFLAAIARVF